MKCQSLQRVRNAQTRNSKIKTGSNGLEYLGLTSQFCKKRISHLEKKENEKYLLAQIEH